MGDDARVSPLVYRPTFVRVLSVLTWVLLAVALVATAVADPADGLRWAPLLAGVGAVVHALFWRPSVEVDDEGVTVRNVVRDVRVPWSRLDAVETRYALTLTTGSRRITAWAAPAPGSASLVRQSRREAAGLAALGVDLDRGLQSSASPGSDSGGAAFMVRARWEQALARPAPDPPGDVRVRWAAVPLLLLSVSAVGTLLAVLVPT